jgi:hypothetical protein
VTRVDYVTALAALEAVVAERGEDFIYEPVTLTRTDEGGMEHPTRSCVYFVPETGEPSCGVGATLPSFGISREDLKIESAFNRDLNSGAGVSRLVSSSVLDATQKAVDLFSEFQRLQDLREPYGPALRRAVRHAETRGGSDL